MKLRFPPLSRKAKFLAAPAPVIVCLLASAWYSGGFSWLSLEDARLNEGRHAAELNFIKMRSGNQREVDELFLLYGRKLPFSQVCYQNAVFSYIEEKSNAIAMANGCRSMTSLCPKDPQFAEAIDKNLAVLLARSEKERQLTKKREIEFDNALYILSPVHVFQLISQLDPHGEQYAYSDIRPKATDRATEMTDDDLKNQLSDFQNYFASCDVRKPPSWSMADGPLPTSDMASYIYLKLTYGHSLIEAAVVSQLPASDKGYVGCLSALNATEQRLSKCTDVQSCEAEAKPKSKDSLAADLEDFKAHRCSLFYASTIILQSHPELTPLPVVEDPKLPLVGVRSALKSMCKEINQCPHGTDCPSCGSSSACLATLDNHLDACFAEYWDKWGPVPHAEFFASLKRCLNEKAQCEYFETKPVARAH